MQFFFLLRAAVLRKNVTADDGRVLKLNDVRVSVAAGPRGHAGFFYDSLKKGSTFQFG